MTNRITTYFHCRQCIRELPAGTAPRDWARTEVGLTPTGLQVWCVRHDIEVVDIEFVIDEFKYKH